MLNIIERTRLENLKKRIEDGTVDDGIPRTRLTKNEKGEYIASLKGFHPQKGSSAEDALSSLHDYLLKYYNKLQNGPTGEHGKDQLRTLEAFLALRICDCKCSEESYCFCRGFETS